MSRLDQKTLFDKKNCKWCKRSFISAESRFNNFCSKRCASQYSASCLLPENRKGTFQKGQEPINKGKTKENCPSLLKASIALKTRYENGELTPSFQGKKHSEETKRRISESRSKWLKDHPDDHPWRRSSKFKSVPCELLKDALRKAGISFIEEYSGFKEHNYSIDIAFPNDKIGIEVNGNQHYNKDGSLTEYYKEREDYLKTLGWKLHQLHYSLVYNQDFIDALIEGLKKDITLNE